MRKRFSSTFGRIAFVAVILSAGMLSWGIAQASSGAANTSVKAPTSNSPSAANAQYSSPGLPPTAQVLWAVVNSNGRLARGFPAGTSSLAIGFGSYVVGFARPVASCSYQVTVGETHSVGTAAGFGTAEGAFGAPTFVFVNTFDSLGTEAKEPFHLAVLC